MKLIPRDGAHEGTDLTEYSGFPPPEERADVTVLTIAAEVSIVVMEIGHQHFLLT